MNNQSGIYAIVNKISGKKYVGSAINIPSRWRVHVFHLRKGDHHSKKLQNAWNKYGSENFDFIVIQNCNVEDLLSVEQTYLDNLSPFYNTNKIAGSVIGYRFSEEQKQRMAEIHTGFRHTEESKKLMSTIWSRKPRGKYSEERCANISLSRKGKKPTQNQLAGLEAGRRAPKSEETRKKISDAQKGYQPTEATLEKLRAAWVRRKERAVSNA